MNEVQCLDLSNGRTFTLRFDNLRKQRAFIVKCRYSHKIKVIGFTWNSQSEYEYLEYGR